MQNRSGSRAFCNVLCLVSAHTGTLTATALPSLQREGALVITEPSPPDAPDATLRSSDLAVLTVARYPRTAHGGATRSHTALRGAHRAAGRPTDRQPSSGRLARSTHVRTRDTFATHLAMRDEQLLVQLVTASKGDQP